MIVLGISVSTELQDRWREWLAPDAQPFFVESLRSWPSRPSPGDGDGALPPELVDTYKGWRIDRSLKTLWLDEAAFLELSPSERARLVRTQVAHGRGAVPSVRRWSGVLDAAALRSRGDGHRFVWWPSLLASDPRSVLSRVVLGAPEGAEQDALPSRHGEVDASTWRRGAAALPGARRVAGSFPAGSGPNCFGTVMAAAGVAGAEHEQVVQAPFLAWLDAACRPGGRDDDAGTVLVWRAGGGGGGGLPVHAAVTLGDGWALEKASGEWWTPRAVRTVADVIRSSRARGQRLERHRIIPAVGSR